MAPGWVSAVRDSARARSSALATTCSTRRSVVVATRSAGTYGWRSCQTPESTHPRYSESFRERRGIDIVPRSISTMAWYSALPSRITTNASGTIAACRSRSVNSSLASTSRENASSSHPSEGVSRTSATYSPVIAAAWRRNCSWGSSRSPPRGSSRPR